MCLRVSGRKKSRRRTAGSTRSTGSEEGTNGPAARRRRDADKRDRYTPTTGMSGGGMTQVRGRTDASFASFGPAVSGQDMYEAGKAPHNSQDRMWHK